MYHPTQPASSKPVVNNPISQPPLRLAFLLIPLALALAWLALSPAAQAVTPAPDGGYPNFTTAEGDNALFNLTTGTNNTAIGFHALFTTTTGISNTATGESALFGNTTGDFNTATGDVALFSNTTGGQNTAYGDGALFFNTTGNNNIALGVLAGTNLTAGDDNIDIGNGGVAGDSGKIRIGTKAVQKRAFIAGISGSAVTGSAVVVDTSGQLGVAPSSARFKDAITPMDKASEAILELKPVTFHYKHELDPEGIPQFGLVAEQVEKVNPALVARDADGKIYTVRYEAVNAMLLNEFLKEHRKVGELEATAAQQQKEIKALTASVKEQAAQIQKVSDKVEMSRPSPQMVSNNQ